MKPEIKIESGIPIPDGNSRQRPYPSAMCQMNVGDSFTAPRTLQVQMPAYAKTAKVKIKTRKIDDQTIRVWRTA